MNKYTTQQLQAATLGLAVLNDADGTTAYQMAFEELHARMGDVAFDAWCSEHLDSVL